MLRKRSIYEFFIVSAILCGSSPSFAQIKVGGLLHLTGEIAIQGEAFRQGMELAAAELNGTSAGTGAKPIVALEFQDTESKPAVALSGAQRLIADGMDVILISTANETRSVAVPLAKAKIPAIVLWDSSPELEAMGPYVFAIGPWTPASGETGAEYAREVLHAKTAAIIDTDTEWSQSVSHYFSDAFIQGGGKIIAKETVLPNEQDFRTIFFKVRATHPDIIFAPIDGSIPQFFRQRKQLAVSIPTLTADIITEDYFRQDANIYEGIFASQTIPPEGSELQKKYQAHFNHPCEQLQFVAWGYDGVMLAAKAHEDTALPLRDALQKITGFSGESGTISFGRSRSSPTAIGMYQVSAGTLARQ